MANFTESQIQGMLKTLEDDMGYPATRELAILELEDLKRKGCLCERTDGYCIGCSAMGACPMNDWEKRHPEYKNDSLACKIKILEAGGEEAYKAKLKAQEEAKKKAEEEAQKATDADRANACRYLLNLFYKSKTTATEAGILDLINNILYAKTKVEIWDKISKDDFNLLMKCKNLYQRCIAYSGRNVHDVNGAAGNLLNGVDHFLFSFTENFINKKNGIDSLNEEYADEGGWEGHTRKFLVEQAIPRALKALAEKQLL